MQSPQLTHEVLLSRLAEFGIEQACCPDPWGVGFSPDLIWADDWLEEEPYDASCEEWDAERHAARIRFLMESEEEMRSPVSIDCECSGGHVYPVPVICDGWHRLHAHWALSRTTIAVAFGGGVDLIEYLEGATDEL